MKRDKVIALLFFSAMFFIIPALVSIVLRSDAMFYVSLGAAGTIGTVMVLLIIYDVAVGD